MAQDTAIFEAFERLRLRGESLAAAKRLTPQPAFNPTAGVCEDDGPATKGGDDTSVRSKIDAHFSTATKQFQDDARELAQRALAGIIGNIDASASTETAIAMLEAWPEPRASEEDVIRVLATFVSAYECSRWSKPEAAGSEPEPDGARWRDIALGAAPW